MTASADLFRDSVNPLVGLLAVIPIGFVVYQMYYFSYDPLVRLWPFPWTGRLIRNDRGAQVLQALESTQLDALREIFDAKLDIDMPHKRVGENEQQQKVPIPIWRLVLRVQAGLKMLELRDSWHEQHAGKKARAHAYSDRWHENWDVLRAVVDIAGSDPSTGQIKHEYTVLSDLYHALGASRTALSVGLGGVVTFAVLYPNKYIDHPVGSTLGLVLVWAITAGIWVVFHLARRRTWRSAASSLEFGLRWLLRRHPELFVSKTKRAKKAKKAAADPGADDGAGRSMRERLRGRFGDRMPGGTTGTEGENG